MPAKRLNKNLIISLTLFVFVMTIVSAVLLIRRVQQRDPAYFVEHAQRYASAGEWQSAAIFYKKAWDRTGDGSHLVSLGDALLNDGQVVEAFAAWRTALVDDPGLTDGHIRLIQTTLEFARLYGRAEDWQRLREAAEVFLASPAERSPLEEALARRSIGLALASAARPGDADAQRAEQELRSAAQLDPSGAEVLIELAAHLVQQSRAEEAERLFEELFATHTGTTASASKVRLAYARFCAGRDRFEDADRLFRESEASAGGSPQAMQEAKLGFALFLSQQWARAVRQNAPASQTVPLYEQAEQILRDAIQAGPDDYEAYLQLAVLYGTAQRHRDVETVCTSRLERGLSRKGIEAAKNRLAAFTLMIYASEACVSEGLAAGQADRLDEKEQWLQKAERYVAEARGELPSHPRVLGQSGRVKLARGLDREALRDLRAADEAYRTIGSVNWENTLTLTRLHLRLNEPGAAKAVLEEVLETARRDRTNDPAFWTLYAQVLLGNEENERALSICDQILLADPRNGAALRLKAAIYERQGRAEDAGRMYEQLTGDRVVRAILSARQAMLDGRTEEGLAVLRAALEVDPVDPRLVAAAVRELVSLQRPEKAREVVQRALSIAPDDDHLRRLAVLTRDDLATSQRDQAMLEIIQQEEDGYERALQLVGYHVARKDYAAGLRAINDALSHLTARNTPLARAADAVQRHGLLWAKMSVAGAVPDPAALAEARDEAARDNLDGVGGKSFLGFYHLQQKEYDLAIKAFQETVAALPTDSRSWTHLGICLQLVERAEEARDAFEQAARLNPGDGMAHRGLASLAKAGGDREAYEQAIRTCERLIPNEPWVATELLVRKEQAEPKAGIERREAMLREKPDDMDNLKRLAALSEVVGDRERADRYCQRLLELSGDDRDVVSVSAAYFRRTGRPAQALQTIQGYTQSRSVPSERAFGHLLAARHYLEVKNVEEAERSLQQAAAAAETLEVARTLADFYVRTFRRPDKALPWLDKAVELGKASKSAQLPAIMAMRVACLLDRRIDDNDKARRGIEELSAAFPDYPQVLLLRSETQSRGGDLVGAVDSLHEYLRRYPNDIQAYYQRALHRITLGRMSEAVADLEAVKRIAPLALDLQPRLLLARLHQLAGRKEQWTRELETLVVDSDGNERPVEELLRAFLTEGRLSEAGRVVTAQINRSARPNAKWFFWRGQIALQAGEPDRALADLHRGAELSGFTSDALLQALGAYLRLGQFSEGISYCDRYITDESRSGQVLSARAVLLARTGRSKEAAEQFRGAMEAALHMSPVVRAAVLGDLAAAVSDPTTGPGLVAALQEPPTDPATSRANGRLLAELWRATGQLDRAVKQLEEWIAGADREERAEALNLLGNIAHTAGHPDLARAAYEEALASNPDDWITLNNLAYLLFDRFGQAALARPHAERAVALAENADTLDTLGWIYVGMGEHQRAIAALSRAIRLNPSAALSYHHLGEALRRGSRFQEATGVLTAGRDIGRTTGDAGTAASCENALERVARSDHTP